MFLKRGKKGISPLIATVLLIAFAVSIGVLIMTIGNNFKTNEADCNSTNIAIQTHESKQLFCFDRVNNKILITVRNTGSTNIEALKLVTTGQDNKIDELVIGDTKMEIGDIKSKTVDFVRTDIFKAELIPIIMMNGQERTCLNQEVSVELLPDC